MLVRLRRARKSIIAVVVALGFAGSALLAVASAAPVNAAYPVTASKVKASGSINSCTSATKPKCTTFKVSLQHKTNGTIVGSYKLKDALTGTNYSFTSKGFTSMVCVGNSVTFHGTTGKASGSVNKGKTFSSDTTIVSIGTPTMTTTIRDESNNAVVYNNGGVVTGKVKVAIAC